jgi:hypothetical protein
MIDELDTFLTKIDWETTGLYALDFYLALCEEECLDTPINCPLTPMTCRPEKRWPAILQ